MNKQDIYKVVPLDVIAEMYNYFRLDKHGEHGYEHWIRVIQNGLAIAKNIDGNEKIVIAFGFFHDVERITDGDDPEHGFRGGEFAKKYKNRLGLTESEFDKLYNACEGHNYRKHTTDKDIGMCWDADRLDLYRDKIIPDPDFLNSDYSRSDMAIYPAMRRSWVPIKEWAQEIMKDIEELTDEK